MKSSLPFISRLSPGVFGDSRERVRVKAKGRDGELEGRREGGMDGWMGGSGCLLKSIAA